MDSSSRIILDTLPPEHPLRNRPLRDIDAQHEHGQPPRWDAVRKWLIGRASYNQLGEVWHSGRFSVVSDEPAPDGPAA